MKWNSYDIMNVLQIYEQYPVLWNKKDKKYSHVHTKTKDEFFKKMYKQLEDEGLLKGMNEKQLKSKIKGLKDVYRQELAKIEKSKRNCSGIQTYTPKLMWFYSASFFRDILSTKQNQTNVDLPQNQEDILLEVKIEDETSIQDFVGQHSEIENEESSSKDTQIEEEIVAGGVKRKTFSEPSTDMVPPSKTIRRIRRRILPKVTNTTPNVTELKPYDQFGKYIAAELRQLPQRQSILLMQEIQNCITQSKLSYLDSVQLGYHDYAENVAVAEVDLPPQSENPSIFNDKLTNE